MTFSCVFCGCQLQSVRVLLLHLRTTHGKQWTVPYKCGQGTCASIFNEIRHWIRHVVKHCRDSEELGSDSCEQYTSEPSPVCETTTRPSAPPSAASSSVNNSLSGCKKRSIDETADQVAECSSRLVSSLRADRSVTLTMVAGVVKSFSEVHNAIVGSIQDQMPEDGEDRSACCQHCRNVSELLSKEKLVDPFSELDTAAKQTRMIRSHEQYVPSKTYCMGGYRTEVIERHF